MMQHPGMKMRRHMLFGTVSREAMSFDQVTRKAKDPDAKPLATPPCAVRWRPAARASFLLSVGWDYGFVQSMAPAWTATACKQDHIIEIRGDDGTEDGSASRLLVCSLEQIQQHDIRIADLIAFHPTQSGRDIEKLIRRFRTPEYEGHPQRFQSGVYPIGDTATQEISNGEP